MLWESFNEVADGFGLSLDDAQDVVFVLQEELRLGKKELDALCANMFRVLDTDAVGGCTRCRCAACC